MVKIFFFIIIILLYTGSSDLQINTGTPNIFIPTISFLWNDWENWSKKHVPYIGEDVVLSSGSIVQLYNPGISTIVGKINIANSCVFTINSEFISKNITTLAGSLIIFADVQLNKIYLNNSLIWIMNNASLYCDDYLLLNNKDIIIAGPYTFSNIYSIVINYGKLLILQNTRLFIKDYFQMPNSILTLYYNSTINDIGFLYGNSLNIFGKILLECSVQIKIKKQCIPIISAIYSLHLDTPIVDICKYMTKYMINNNTALACF